jgi:hypothetical protein
MYNAWRLNKETPSEVYHAGLAAATMHGLLPRNSNSKLSDTDVTSRVADSSGQDLLSALIRKTLSYWSIYKDLLFCLPDKDPAVLIVMYMIYIPSVNNCHNTTIFPLTIYLPEESNHHV